MVVIVLVWGTENGRAWKMDEEYPRTWRRGDGEDEMLKSRRKLTPLNSSSPELATAIALTFARGEW